MNCDLMQRVSAYHDGELSPPEARAFETHLAICSECQRELTQVRELSRLLSRIPHPQMSARLSERLRRFPTQPTMLLAEELMAAAAAVLIVFGGWILLGVGSGSTHAAASSWERAAVTLRADAGGDTQQFAQWVVEDLSVENRHD